jgi:type 1 glutamine amidotransferase
MMNRRIKVTTVLLIVVLCLCLGCEMSSRRQSQDRPLKALIVNGQNNHNWKASSPLLKEFLEQTGVFEVDTATSPPKNSSEAEMEEFRPNFSPYHVVVLDYNGQSWPKKTKKNFVKYVKSGGGVVVYHAADNAFPEWKQYNEIIGLGGWKNRNEKDGPYIRLRDGHFIRDMTPGRAGSHGEKHRFEIVNRYRAHPITRDLPAKWTSCIDELYSELRGPAMNLTILATAYADPGTGGSGEHEPVLFTVKYGKGRVFHTVLGHCKGVPAPEIECPSFIVTFQRGAEWAATGDVTQKTGL